MRGLTAEYHWEKILCTRNDDPDGVTNFRVLATLSYALGTAFMDKELQAEMIAKVVSLHDHKGGLTVTSTTRLSDRAQRIFAQAWEDVAIEPVIEFEVASS